MLCLVGRAVDLVTASVSVSVPTALLFAGRPAVCKKGRVVNGALRRRTVDALTALSLLAQEPCVALGALLGK